MDEKKNGGNYEKPELNGELNDTEKLDNGEMDKVAGGGSLDCYTGGAAQYVCCNGDGASYNCNFGPGAKR